MNTFQIKFLRQEDHKYLRVIRCKGKEYNRYTLFLFYIRDFEYDKLDDLDETILESLNQTQDAVFELNQKILFEGQLEEILTRYRLEETKDITVQLNPIITDELIRQVQIGAEIFSYLKYFKASFRKGHDFMHLSNYFVGYLDNKKLIQLQGTMKTL